MHPEENRPCITRDRANTLSDKLHEIADELLKFGYHVEDIEQDNPLVGYLCDAVAGHANSVAAISRCMGDAWRIER